MTTRTYTYAHVARLTRLAAHNGPIGGSAPIALQASRALTAPTVERLALPAGASYRTVDDEGRLKFNGSAPVSELVGWSPGALEVTFDGPWALITQTSSMVGCARQRHSSLAHLTRDDRGIERICLAPAHQHRLTLGADRGLFVAPYPAAGGLLVVTPEVALAGAPARLLTQGSDSETSRR